MKLPIWAQQQLEIIKQMKDKALEIANTLNPSKAKRLGAEILESATELSEESIIKQGSHEVEINLLKSQNEALLERVSKIENLIANA